MKIRIEQKKIVLKLSLCLFSILLKFIFKNTQFAQKAGSWKFSCLVRFISIPLRSHQKPEPRLNDRNLHYAFVIFITWNIANKHIKFNFFVIKLIPSNHFSSLVYKIFSPYSFRGWKTFCRIRSRIIILAKATIKKNNIEWVWDASRRICLRIRSFRLVRHVCVDEII